MERRSEGLNIVSFCQLFISFGENFAITVVGVEVVKFSVAAHAADIHEERRRIGVRSSYCTEFVLDSGSRAGPASELRLGLLRGNRLGLGLVALRRSA